MQYSIFYYFILCIITYIFHPILRVRYRPHFLFSGNYFVKIRNPQVEVYILPYQSKIKSRHEARIVTLSWTRLEAKNQKLRLGQTWPAALCCPPASEASCAMCNRPHISFYRWLFSCPCRMATKVSHHLAILHSCRF